MSIECVDEMAKWPGVVFLLTTGDGTDGDEWSVVSVHLTRESAERAKVEFERERVSPAGRRYSFRAVVEEWPANM